MRKLEADIKPLQDSNAELSEKSGMLQAEKRLLEEDVKRLKTRTQVSESHCSRLNAVPSMYHVESYIKQHQYVRSV